MRSLFIRPQKRFLPQLLLAALALMLTGNTAKAATETILYDFQTLALGQYPSGGLVSDASGNLYGTTYYGGAYDSGAVFIVTPLSTGGWVQTVIYSFKCNNGGSTDGCYPTGSLVFDTAGNLYGATTAGGTSGVGTIFRITPGLLGQWTEHIVWNFQQTNPHDGFNAQGGLVFDQAGNLYGTTRYGGGWNQVECSFDGGCGTIFRLTPHSNGTWTETVLYVFQGNEDGAYPNDGLVIDHNGNLYGTNGGLSSSHGLVFELTPAPTAPWTETTLYKFSGGADGAYPNSGLIFDQSNNFYGTTTGGGNRVCSFNSFCGTVFKLTAGTNNQWTESVLYSFNGIDGQGPDGKLTFDQAGNLYGTTGAGGTDINSGGVAFKLAPNSTGDWTETVLWNSIGKGNLHPAFGVLLGPAGELYGSTNTQYFGPGNGMIFKLTPSASGPWDEMTLTSFSAVDGGIPRTNLISDAEGNLYGTTSQGGTRGFGTVFRLKKSATGSWTKKTIYNFPSGVASGPFTYSNPSALIFDSAGNLYGETTYGGKQHFGTVFQLSNTIDGWVETRSFQFSGGAGGQFPSGGLIFDTAGNLYGTTQDGGTGVACNRGCGTIFKLSPGAGNQWTETLLYNFQGGSDGAGPSAGLAFDQSGNLFGTTRSGGIQIPPCNSGCGTVFELAPISGGGWTEKILHRFTNAHLDGAGPMAGLIFDHAGNLYGATLAGGKHDETCGYSGCGTVFELSPSSGGIWSENTIHAFDASDGKFPIGGLAFDLAGNLYGTTEEGGSVGWGSVFKLTPASGGVWNETVLYSFSAVGGGDGYFPEASLFTDQSGNLYGTTAGGGNGNHGTVFQITP